MKRGVTRPKVTSIARLLVGVVGLILLSPATALAATAPSASNGYRLSPVRTDLTIKPGASETVNVILQNASSDVENVQTLVNDFQPPTNESGDPALLLNGATAPDHSLKQFVTISAPTFTLQPNQQKIVAVTVKVPLGVAAGGYYGAIRFAPQGATTGKNVNLSASVASLVLLTVPGNLDEQLSIVGFGPVKGNGTSPQKWFLNNKDLHAIVRFRNSGNVQEQPFGRIELKRGSKQLNSYAVNNSAAPGNVLPDSVRRFSVSLDKVSWYGKYKLIGNFGYGSKGQLLTSTATFYIIPVIFIVIAVLLLLLLVFLIFGLPRLIRAYNRRVIAKANRRNQHNQRY